MAALLLLGFSAGLHAQSGSSFVYPLTITPDYYPTYNDAITANVLVRDANSDAPLTGTVDFSVDGGSPIAATLNSAGLAYANLGQLSIGTHSVTATYLGNAQYSGGSISGSVQINDATLAYVGTQGTALFADGTVNDVEGVAVDAQDNLYVADKTSNVVKKEDTSGNITTIPLTGLQNPVGLALDSSGNLYVADTGNNRIVKFSTSGAQTTAPVTGLSGPTYLAYDRNYDVLYIVDPGNNRIVSFTPSSGVSANVVTGMTALRGVAVDASGNIYFSDKNAGFMEIDTFGDQFPIFAAIKEPGGITANLDNYIILSDTSANTVIRYDNSTYGTTLGEQVQINDGGNPVIGMASDSTGRVYLALGGRVDVLAPGSERVPDFAVHSTSAFSLIFQGSLDKLNFSVTAAPGTTFSADPRAGLSCPGSAGACVFSPIDFTPQVAGVNSGSFTVFTSQDLGSLLLWGKGIGGAAAFSPGLNTQSSSGAAAIGGVALDAAGNRYVTDSKNNTVLKIPPSGAATTLAFTGLSKPTQVAVDALGTVYVLDSGNECIDQLSTNGVQSYVFCATGDEGSLSTITAFAMKGDSNLVVAGLTGNYVSIKTQHSPKKARARHALPAQDSGDDYSILFAGNFNEGAPTALLGTAFEYEPLLTNSSPEITGLALDADENVFAIDVNGDLWRYGVDGSMGKIATKVSNPVGVAVDASNTAYVAGSSSSSITLVPPDRTLSSIQVNGIYNPAGLALDDYGDILLGDSSDEQLVYLDRTQQNYVFGDVNVGSSESLDGSISNIGNQPFTISGPLPGDNNFVQASGSNACAAPPAATTATTLAPVASCDLDYTFTPPSAGPFTLSGTLVTTPQTLVGSTGGGGIQLSGTGVGSASGPQPVLTPSTMDFGNVPIGTTSAAQTATLQNTGTAALPVLLFNVTGKNPGGFGYTDNCGNSLAAGASCSIQITCDPVVVETLTATFNANFPSPIPQQSIALTCNGRAAAAPQAALTPATASFGNVAEGSTSAAQTFILANAGNAALAISSVSLGGTNASEFAIASNGCGTTLAASAKCSISVTFAPSAPGSATATLSVADNATGSPQTSTLTGTGTTTAAAPAATLTPSTLNFGSVQTGTTSAAQTATLTNTGSAVLTIAGISLTGTNNAAFATTNNCGGTVAAGASCTISVTFDPTATGTDTASLSVSDNAPGSPQTSSLTGTATAPPVAADFTVAATPASQSVASGSGAAYQVNVASVNGSFTEAVALTASGLPPGATVTFAPASVTPGSGGATSTMTIQTAAQQASVKGSSSQWPLPVGLISAAVLILPFRRRKRIFSTLGCALLLLGVGGGLTACGAGFALPQTPPAAATYTVTVTGTSGSLQHSTTVQITVR